MPSFTTFLKDTSPLLVYSANWRAGTSESDGALDQYTQSSHTLTQAKGSSMSFSFYGTAIGIFGAKNTNHGAYTVQLDGKSSAPLTGQASAPQFQQNMFSATAALGVHNVTLVTGDTSFFTLDFVTFQTNVGQDGEQLIVNTFQDTHPSFTYSPSTSWKTPDVDGQGGFSGGSGHVTTDPAATATFTFQGKSGINHVFYIHSLDAGSRTGDTVELFGPVGPSGAATYSVQVDNRGPAFFSANKQFYRPQQMLFQAGNLGAGQHSLRVQLGSTAAGEFAIDYANVYTTPSLGGSFLAMTSDATTSRIPTGAIAGLAITTTLAILACLLCIYMFWRQRYELLHYAPPPNPKVPVEDAKFVNPFMMSPATERTMDLPRLQTAGGPQSYPRGHAYTSSTSTASPKFAPLFLPVPPPTVVGGPSTAGTLPSSGIFTSSVHGTRAPSSVGTEEVTMPRVPVSEKGGLHLSYEEEAPHTPFTGALDSANPPPEYSRNPNGTVAQLRG